MLGPATGSMTRTFSYMRIYWTATRTYSHFAWCPETDRPTIKTRGLIERY